ncbi:PadR family transcriptional regulator [Cytobacillus sp. FJAT-54145]|uniref:PadR family transcriptional regulator n=1 Tax=Cytobacillus spartinae TaxID=3299023 RepID=A0ABW6KCX6_9BACI
MSKIAHQFLPLTYSTFYILISLLEPRHGYGIMQKVEELSKGETKLGAGTIYGALSKLEKQNLIKKEGKEDSERRKSYILTSLGKEVVMLEFARLEQLVRNGKEYIDELNQSR